MDSQPDQSQEKLLAGSIARCAPSSPLTRLRFVCLLSIPRRTDEETSRAGPNRTRCRHCRTDGRTEEEVVVVVLECLLHCTALHTFTFVREHYVQQLARDWRREERRAVTAAAAAATNASSSCPSERRQRRRQRRPRRRRGRGSGRRLAGSTPELYERTDGRGKASRAPIDRPASGGGGGRGGGRGERREEERKGRRRKAREGPRRRETDTSASPKEESEGGREAIVC